jgi:hypothetical protein
MDDQIRQRKPSAASEQDEREDDADPSHARNLHSRARNPTRLKARGITPARS